MIFSQSLNTKTLKKQNGFTLLELLVELGIFALLATMAYSGLDSVMKARQVTNQHADRLSHLPIDRKSTRLNSSHVALSRMPSSA